MLATRPIICLTECSRAGDPIWPRKYFWATMFVAFCDHVFGNSTPRCSKEILSPWPIRASRSSHSTASNGWTPGFVKYRRIERPWPVASGVSWVCEVCSIPTCSSRIFRQFLCCARLLFAEGVDCASLRKVRTEHLAQRTADL